MSVIEFNPNITVKDGDAITITGTFKKNGTWSLGGGNGGTTTTSGGTWSGLLYDEIGELPDMTDWSASDIIDHFAKILAERHPA